MSQLPDEPQRGAVHGALRTLRSLRSPSLLGRGRKARSAPLARLLALALCAVGLSYGWGFLAQSAPEQREPGTLSAGERALAHSRRGLEEILAYMAERPELFPRERRRDERVPSSEQRALIWGTWESFLDHVLALDSIGRQFGELDRYPDRSSQKAAFKLAFAAFLTQYRFALDFIERTENDPTLHKVLNEAAPDRGIASDTYSQVKYRFLNLIRGAEFARLAAVDSFYGEAESTGTQAMIDADKAVLWQAGIGRGPLLTVENGLQIVRDAGFTAWFPVQKGVSEWMGDTKVLRQGRSLIHSEQIADMARELLPGDILLERREWYLSNIGLPGFWPHAALYIGSAEERRAYFGDAFEGRLAQLWPEAHARSATAQEDDHLPRVIEAISEGVSFTTLEHSADADAVVVLRPRLDKEVKARAVERAFALQGRPYDFDFDFVTDSALVCTELVAKAYEPDSELPGLEFPQLELVGRIATPANEIARQFDANFGTPRQQLDFVLFLDGNERAGVASRANLDEFRRSWRRPKWHIFVQGIATDEG